MARVRRKLRHVASARAVTDTGDIFSAMLAKVDRLAADGRLRAATDGAIWALALTVCNRLVLENARVADRLQRLKAAYSDHRRPINPDLNGAASEHAATSFIPLFLASFPSETDREVLILKLHDVPNSAIAASLGIAPHAVRQRWSRLCRTARFQEVVRSIVAPAKE